MQPVLCLHAPLLSDGRLNETKARTFHYVDANSLDQRINPNLGLFTEIFYFRYKALLGGGGTFTHFCGLL